MKDKNFVINGGKVQSLRVAKELSQADLAFESNISTSVLSKIENGKHHNVRLQTLMNLSLALECSPMDLVSYY